MPDKPCRFCGAALELTFVDLGTAPLSNGFLRASQLDAAESFYPLRAYVCGTCLLVQLEAFETPESIFRDYAYFSSITQSWVKHAETYVHDVIQRFALGRHSRVVEVASNDGYLLQYFVRAGVPALGIEPARNIAAAAEAAGIPTLCEFFGTALAHRLHAEARDADLLIGNNVLAHVPDLNDFVAGLKIVLKREGVLTMEFPHLLRLIAENQFDTIYHEHFSYFSLATAQRVFAAHGLAVFDVEEIPTHGGSLRIYARHAGAASGGESGRLRKVMRAEESAGLTRIDGYRGFEPRVQACKRELLRFLIDAKEQGKSVVGYGAPAKGNTLLNYCGIRTDLLEYTVDRSPHKQGLFLPGTRIPVHAPERIAETRPDYVLILPWNIRDDIIDQLSDIKRWGGRFVVPIPGVQVLEART